MRCFKLTLSLNFVVSLRSNFFVFDSFLEFYGCIVCVSDCDCKKKKAIVVTPLQFTVFQHSMANNVQRILFWWCIMDFHKNSIRFEINHEIWNKRHEYALSNRHQFLCAIDNQQQQNRESVKSQNHIKTIRYVYMDLVALFCVCEFFFFCLFVCLTQIRCDIQENVESFLRYIDVCLIYPCCWRWKNFDSIELFIRNEMCCFMHLRHRNYMYYEINESHLLHVLLFIGMNKRMRIDFCFGFSSSLANRIHILWMQWNQNHFGK